MWDPSVSLGNVISILVFVFSLASLHIANVRRFERMAERLDIIYQWWRDHISKENR